MIREQLALHYSAQEYLTIVQLKKGDYDASLSFQELESYCDEHAIGAVVYGKDGYPSSLARSSYHPFLFYYQGNIELLNYPMLGVVGPRMPSEYALQVMDTFFAAAQNFQLVSVSGFARGIDQKAHQLSLDLGIPTIAILGGGFKHYLSSRDRSFLQKIVENGGLILSEFKLGFQPTKWSFPQRNKFIASLSDVLFLPEAREKSGSLITAEFAYKMGKPVFSVPAPIFSSQSAGIFSKVNEKKIRFVTNFHHCLGSYFVSRKENHPSIPTKLTLTDAQSQLLSIVSDHEEVSIEHFMGLGFAYQDILQELTFLEMNKQIEEFQPGKYRKKFI